MLVTTFKMDGRLHIGCGDKNGELPKHLGDVNIYDNCLAKIITKIFCKSLDISIGGATYCVNKNSYRKHLDNIKASYQKNNLKTFNYDGFIASFSDSKTFLDQCLKLPNYIYLSDAFPKEYRTKLTKIVLDEIITKNPLAVKYCVLRGASPLKEFFMIDPNSTTYYEEQKDIEQAIANTPNNDGYYGYSIFSKVVELNSDPGLARFLYNVLNKDFPKYVHANVTKYKKDPVVNLSNKIREIEIQKVVKKDDTPGQETFELK